jgi:hypothetical protein
VGSAVHKVAKKVAERRLGSDCMDCFVMKFFALLGTRVWNREPWHGHTGLSCFRLVWLKGMGGGGEHSLRDWLSLARGMVTWAYSMGITGLRERHS